MSSEPIPARTPLDRCWQPLGLALCTLTLCAVFASSCRREPREPDLPKQPDRWLNSIALGSDSTAKYIGKTKQFVMADLTQMKNLDGGRAINVGDEVAGLRIGAIKCSFHWRDASYGGEKYMWRGRWACMAGRSKKEIEAAVSEDGKKRFDYILVVPVRLLGD